MTASIESHEVQDEFPDLCVHLGAAEKKTKRNFFLCQENIFKQGKLYAEGKKILYCYVLFLTLFFPTQSKHCKSLKTVKLLNLTFICFVIYFPLGRVSFRTLAGVKNGIVLRHAIFFF